MKDRTTDNSVRAWFQEALLMALGGSQQYFDLAQQAINDGTPENALEPLYELDKQLCNLLGDMPDSPACEAQVPILRRIVARCDMAIAATWLQLRDQNPNDPDFGVTALEAAWEQYAFFRDLPDYNLAADEGLPEDVRLFYLRLGKIFDS